jgi:peptidoglycan/xylan/chitin deacetylase (PgdA/CDA1 family)
MQNHQPNMPRKLNLPQRSQVPDRKDGPNNPSLPHGPQNPNTTNPFYQPNNPNNSNNPNAQNQAGTANPFYQPNSPDFPNFPIPNTSNLFYQPHRPNVQQRPGGPYLPPVPNMFPGPNFSNRVPTPTRSSTPPPSRTRARRKPKRLLAVGIALGLVASLILTLSFFYENVTTTGPSHNTPITQGTQLPHSLTPMPTQFVRQPGPPPVTPFPTTLNAQISALVAKDRFLSYGSTYQPEVALTFDDGPSIYTPQVLDVLKRYNVKATFFCLGEHVVEHPDFVKREQQEGHTIGNHTWTHPHLPTISSQDIITELTNTGDILQKVTGIRPTLFRPPYGEYDPHVLMAANQFGLTTVIWNTMSRDWENPPPAVISSRTLNNAGNGAIVLLHDGGGDPRANTVAALPTIIEGLKARGIRLVTVPQMIIDMHKTAMRNNLPHSLQPMTSIPGPGTVPTLSFDEALNVYPKSGASLATGR